MAPMMTSGMPSQSPRMELLEGDDEAIGSLPLEDSDDEGGDAAGAISDDDMFDDDMF